MHLCDFAAQALTRTSELRSRAVAVLGGEAPLEKVFAMSSKARELGVKASMSRVQAESFAVELLRRDRYQEEQAFAELLGCAQQFSPRVETIASPREESCGATLVLDISGSERLLGSPHQIASALRQSACALGYESNVASAHNACSALMAARGISGVNTIAMGCEAERLAPLPLSVLELGDALAQTFSSWGIHTLGQLAALPTKSLAARLGQSGVRMQAQARGEYSHLLVPIEEDIDAAICESLELEHPVELLESLLFLLSQMLEQILQRAAQRAQAIASVETCLVLERNVLDRGTLDGAFKADAHYEHRRTVRPTLPERDRSILLKLIQLDLELHPPESAVIALRIEAHPARPQTAQQGLFAAQAPEAGRLEILLARLRKLVGEERVGAPELLDTNAPEAFRITNFEIGQTANTSRSQTATQQSSHSAALRMVRPPHAIAIELHSETLSAMHYEGKRLMLQTASGPWRTNGAWWTHPSWCREEWDVVLQEQPQRCLRLAHDPSASCWYLIGIYD
jgi:protein ImuB